MTTPNPEPATATATRILLVDDHEMVRAGLRIILSSQPDLEVVGEAGTGREAIAVARALQPDVICMDVQMPDMDGLEATAHIVADPGITASLLILTTFDRDDFLFAALRAGASGFLLKNSAPERLIEAVRVVAGGEALLAPDLTRRVLERFAGPGSGTPDAGEAGGGAGSPARGLGAGEAERPSAVAAEATSPLTEREREVLGLVARGLSNAEIATALYVGEATVKSHVSKVLQKLGLRDRIQAVIYSYEHGIQVPRGG